MESAKSMKEVIIYQKGETKIYIHKGKREKGHKLNWYGIRRDDKTGLANILGIIRFDGGWRQFIFFPELNTKWSAGCKEEIAKFERKITKEWRNRMTHSQNILKNHRFLGT